MNFSNFIKRNLKTFERSKQKRKAIQSILNSEQLNTGVTNLHRIDINNVGDYYCAPHHYFTQLKNKQLDIFDYKSSDDKTIKNWTEKISNNALIIGGGGLLNRGCFEKQMRLFEQLTTKGKKTVLWGIGHNSKSKRDFDNITTYNIDVNKFGLVGVRDYKMSNNWVPCVSCMHTVFDKSYVEEQEIGVIFHKKTLKNKSILNKLKNYPSSSNTTDLDEICSFIGKSQTIVTDSYHAMYWSMLLGKKVLAIPNSSKFYDFKYKPVFSSFDNFENDISKAESYSGVLEECRDVNLKFADKVFDYLKI